MAKAKKDADRRAVVEQMRREQRRKERRQSLMVLGAAVVVGAVIIGVAVWQFLQAESESERALTSLGVSSGDAGCQEVVTESSAKSNQDHRDVNTPIEYDTAPPAAGPHWPNFLTGAELKPFFTADDRPPVEQLVHSLEHGHTILWYDETIAEDDEAVETVEDLADAARQAQPTAGKFMAAPWTADDGESFPGNTHIALAHWTGPEDQQAVRQYCAEPSGEAVQDFVEQYPASNAPEPTSP